MATTIPGGIYYINGVAVNCDGVAIAGAPKATPNTVPAVAGTPKTLAQEIAEAMATMGNAPAPAPVVVREKKVDEKDKK